MTYLQETLARLQQTSPAQTEFYQAVEEVLESLEPLLEKKPHYLKHSIIERMVEPERQIMFRVCWVDDKGEVQVNKGYRVEFSSTLGPYKGGLRFHPSVNASIIKFLGFEQVFKNALTGLLLGGGKGGSNFNPKGKSDGEIMRFCQAFMSELYRHIGPTTDVPAGDIGVGSREVGYLFGQYKKIKNSYDGVITGKSVANGGSLLRNEATGYGCAYFANYMLEAQNSGLEGKTCLVSGAGNVALHTIDKLYALGAIPVSCSDSSGTLYHADGIDVDQIRKIKSDGNASLKDYLSTHSKAKYVARDDNPKNGNAVWHYKGDLAFPCATQNELTEVDAKALVEAGCVAVVEGANMPCTRKAVNTIVKAERLFAPGKAANAGGVATSQLEMAQHAGMQSWGEEKVDSKLQEIMHGIYTRSHQAAEEFGQPGNLLLGANIAGFRRVADAMIEQGVV